MTVPRNVLDWEKAGQQRCGIRPLTNPADGGLFKSESLVALHFSEAPTRKDLSRKAHPLDCDPLDTTGVGYGGPLSADFGAIDGALRATLGRLPPDHRLPLRAASRRSRPAAFRAQPAPERQARPTFSPASIKLPLGPLAGGSCARAHGPPTIYTPTCVTCASQSSAPCWAPPEEARLRPTQPMRNKGRGLE